MPYSGGSSTNSGVYYQNWFLALQFSYAFFEQDYTIFPEALRTPSIIVDDIVVKSKDNHFFFSLKFRSPSKKHHWSHGDLCSQKILDDFQKQLDVNPSSHLTLISESNCYLFSEVFARARNAAGSYDIYEKLDTDYAIKEWESAKEYLKYDDFEMINFAKKVRIRTIPVEELKFLIKHRFSHVTDQNLIPEFLFEKAVEASSNKTTVNKTTLNNWFQEKCINFFPRS